MPGTRVYLNAAIQDKECVITFKNISKSPLGISCDELMERFVRGDVSRNTEGSGLGLSIAKSLLDLQGGTMQVSSDGDLFKVSVIFPISKPK
jgi:signal transduction histidine kinase